MVERRGNRAHGEGCRANAARPPWPLAQSRNQADALCTTRKSLTDCGDTRSAEKAIEAALKELEPSSRHQEEIDAKVEALSAASQKLGEKMYADMQAAQQGAAEARPADDDVVDADFKEVKRD